MPAGVGALGSIVLAFVYGALNFTMLRDSVYLTARAMFMTQPAHLMEAARGLYLAGVPLDASFAEQKAIMQRCGNVFYDCKEGAEARRFNRLLINAGLIKGL